MEILFENSAIDSFERTRDIKAYLAKVPSFSIEKISTEIKKLEYIAREDWSGVPKDYKLSVFFELYGNKIRKEKGYYRIKSIILMFLSRLSSGQSRALYINEAIYYADMAKLDNDDSIFLRFHANFMRIMTTQNSMMYKTSIRNVVEIISGSEIDFKSIYLVKVMFYRMRFMYRSSFNSMLWFINSGGNIDNDSEYVSSAIESAILGVSHNKIKFFINNDEIKRAIGMFSDLKAISARSFVGINIIRSKIGNNTYYDEIIFDRINKEKECEVYSWVDFFRLGRVYDGEILFLREIFSFRIRRMLISYLYAKRGRELSFLRGIEEEEIERDDADPITLHNYCLRRLGDPEYEHKALEEKLKRAFMHSPHRFRGFPQELLRVLKESLASSSIEKNWSRNKALDFGSPYSWAKLRKNYAEMKANKNLRGTNLDLLIMAIGKMSPEITRSTANELVFNTRYGRSVLDRQVDAVWSIFGGGIHLEANWPEDNRVQDYSKTTEDAAKILRHTQNIGALVCPSGFGDNSRKFIRAHNITSLKKIILVDGGDITQILDESVSVLEIFYTKIAEILSIGEENMIF